MKMQLTPRMKEIFRFAINGGICFLIDAGILYVCHTLLGMHYLIASAIGFTVSVIANYIICVKWVFEGVDGSGAQTKALFLLTSIIGLGLTELLMLLFVDGLHINNVLVSKMLTTFIVMVWNYITKRMALSHSKKKDKPQA